MHAPVKNQGYAKSELETEADPVKQMSHAVYKLLDCVALRVGEIRY